MQCLELPKSGGGRGGGGRRGASACKIHHNKDSSVLGVYEGDPNFAYCERPGSCEFINVFFPQNTC